MCVCVCVCSTISEINCRVVFINVYNTCTIHEQKMEPLTQRISYSLMIDHRDNHNYYNNYYNM